MGSRYEVYRAWDRLLFCEVAVKVIYRPMDHEVHSVESVTGYGNGPVARQRFLPMYATPLGPARSDIAGPEGSRPHGYYTVRRLFVKPIGIWRAVT